MRGREVFWAVELAADRETREPTARSAVAAITSDRLSRGRRGCNAASRLPVARAVVIGEPDAARGLAVIDRHGRKA